MGTDPRRGRFVCRAAFAGLAALAVLATPLPALAVAPAAPVLSGTRPPSPNPATEVAVSGSAEAGSTVQLFATADCTGAAVATGTAADLASGALTVTVPVGSDTSLSARAADPTGAASPCSNSITYRQDSVAPAPPVLTAVPAAAVNQTTVTVGWRHEEQGVRFECRFDSVSATAWTACTSPHAVTATMDGTHSLDVRAIDPAGNVGDPTGAGWLLDTVRPVVTITGPIGPEINDPTPRLAFTVSEQGASLECTVDGSPTPTCLSGTALGPLADGPHTIGVRAVDAAGNVGSATSTLAVDTVAPVVSLDVAPVNPSNNPAPTYRFSSPDAVSFGCSFRPVGSSDTFTACSSPVTFPPVADGSYRFVVQGRDAAGNVGDAVALLTIDTLAPHVTITDKPANPGNVTAPTFGFVADEPADFDCQLDPVQPTWAPCRPGDPVGPLADGSYTFAVRPVDTAGNPGTARSYLFVVDTVAPTVRLGSRPADPTTSDSAYFAFSADETASFGCSLVATTAADTFSACAPPAVSFTLPAPDTYRFALRASDPAGNVAPVTSYVFRYELGPPPPSTPGQPVAQFGSGQLGADGTVPVRLSWPASTSPYGVAGYELSQRQGAGAWRVVATVLAPFAVRRIRADGTTSYGFRVRARDASPSATFSAPSDPGTVRTRLSQDTSRAWTYSGRWATQLVGSASGGVTHWSGLKNSTALLRFSGTGVALVAPRGPYAGRAHVYVDGVRRTAVPIDLYSATALPRMLVFSIGGLSPDLHTLQVQVLGSKQPAARGVRVTIDVAAIQD